MTGRPCSLQIHLSGRSVDAACQFAGIIDVPIYTTLSDDSVRYILDDSSARILILQDQDSYTRLLPFIKDCGSIEKIILFRASPSDYNLLALADLEAAGARLRETEPELIGELCRAVTSEDTATLIYTSGTTGEPKGVMLTHTNLISNVLDASEKYSFSGRDISLSVLPLSHVFERTGMYVYIRYGMQVFYAESIEKVPENLKEVRPTIFIGVPRIFEKVFERARLKAALSGRVNEVIFDWAIEVAKEYAAFLGSGEPVPMALLAKHGIADKVVFSRAARVLWRASAVLHNRRGLAAGRDLSDLYRCRNFDNAGIWSDRNVARHLVKQSIGCTCRNSRKAYSKCGRANC